MKIISRFAQDYLRNINSNVAYRSQAQLASWKKN